MQKYRENLRVIGNKIYSYGTLVGLISNLGRKVYIWQWYSVTTSKHTNYVARELGYEVAKVADQITAESLISNI